MKIIIILLLILAVWCIVGATMISYYWIRIKGIDINNYIRKKKSKFYCEHEYRPSGWSYARCKKCNHRTEDPDKVNKAFNSWIERRSEGMRSAGFSEEYIKNDNSKITPF